MHSGAGCLGRGVGNINLQYNQQSYLAREKELQKFPSILLLLRKSRIWKKKKKFSDSTSPKLDPKNVHAMPVSGEKMSGEIGMQIT